MLIFDGFPDRAKADEFAAKVQKDFGRTAMVFDNEADAQASDPFPFELNAPIVHVSRNYTYEDADLEEELVIERLAPTFGGTFAGT